MNVGVQWLDGRVLDWKPRGRRIEPHRCHCAVSLSKNINPSLVLVQPRKTGLFLTDRLLMGRKESNQTNKQTKQMNTIFGGPFSQTITFSTTLALTKYVHLLFAFQLIS